MKTLQVLRCFSSVFRPPSICVRERERREREMHTYTTNFLHVANYFCVRARERERERETTTTTNFHRVAGQSSQTRVRQEVKNLEYLGTYLLADLVMRQSSLWIFFTEMADRCNETPESSSKKSHTAHARERERERESAIGLESDRQCLFLWKFRTPKKSSAKSGYRRRSVGKKKKEKNAKVAVFFGEKKSDVAIFRE